MRGFQPAGDKSLKKQSSGPVRGPGTGTSDDVQAQVQDGTYIMPTDSTQAIGEQNLAAMGKGAPVDVNLSNGEFKMPPEQVHAVGVQALDQMKDATHTPVAARGLPVPAQQPGEPPLFFVDGGEVDKKKVPAAVDPANLPSPTNIFPGNRLPGNSGTTSAPTQPAAAAPSKPLDAQAASDRAKLGAAWDTVKDVNDDAGRAIADVAMLVPRAVTGAYDSAVVRPMRAAGFNASYLSPSLVPNGVDPSSMTPFTDQKRMQQQPAAIAPATPAATASVAPAASSAQPTIAKPVEGGRGRINPPLANPSAPAPAPTLSQPSPTEIAPGVYRNGNSYSDSAAGAVAGAQTRGLPSAQNMAAADMLAQRSQQESMGRITAAQPVERGWSGVIGTDPAAGRERKAILDSLTTVMPGARGITRSQRDGLQTMLNREAASVNAANNNATALQQTEMQTGTQRDMAAMREAGDNGRAVLREAGETGRAGARNAIDNGRLKLEQDVRGFDIRAGQRQEKLHQKYEAAKTPEEKAAVAQQIRDLSGKAEPTNRFTVVSGGQEWDAAAGAMRNVPGRVLNNQTGQFVEQQGAQAQPQPAPQDAAKRVVGQTYVGPNGKVAKWNGKDWTPV